MVGNINRPDSSGNRDSEPRRERVTQRLTSNHNVDSNAIRRLIQDSLTPMVLDPIPTQILIRDIIVTRDERGLLDITCEVLYEVRRAQPAV